MGRMGRGLAGVVLLAALGAGAPAFASGGDPTGIIIESTTTDAIIIESTTPDAQVAASVSGPMRRPRAPEVPYRWWHALFVWLWGWAQSG